MTHHGGKPHTLVAITSACHGLSSGDVIRIDLPRPAWWRPVALWRWWRSPLRKQARVADVTSTTFTDRQERHGSAGDAGSAGAPAPRLPGSDAGQRHDIAAPSVGGAGDARLLSESAAGCAPLTAAEVRKIVREEIERALRPAGNGVGS